MLAGSASGCGGSDGDGRASASRESRRTPTTWVIPFARWSSRVDAACAAANEQFARVRESIPTTSAQAVGQAADIDRFAHAILGSVDDEGPPEGHEDDAERLRSRLAEMSERTEELTAAADDGDAAGVRAAIVEITTLGGQINPVAIELAVPACGGF